VQLFLEYLRAEPWHDYESDSFFGLSVPGERSPMLGSILGGAGEEFGLGLYRGPEVIAEVHEAMQHEIRTPASNRTSLLSALPIPLRDLDARRRTQLRKVGVRTDPGVLFVARDAGELPRAPSEEEEAILEWALKGTLLAHERRLIEVRELRASGSLSLVRVAGELDAPSLSVEEWPYEIPMSTGARVPSAMLDLRSIPLRAETWIASIEPLPGRIQGTNRAHYTLLVLCPEQGKILGIEILEESTSLEAARVFASMCSGKNSLRLRARPRELICADRELYETLVGTCAEQGTRCSYDPAPGYLLHARALLDRQLRDLR
jgi:uncharacterized protein YuzE